MSLSNSTWLLKRTTGARFRASELLCASTCLDPARPLGSLQCPPYAGTHCGFRILRLMSCGFGDLGFQGFKDLWRSQGAWAYGDGCMVQRLNPRLLGERRIHRRDFLMKRFYSYFLTIIVIIATRGIVTFF